MSSIIESPDHVLRKAEKETQDWKMLIGGKWVDSLSGKRFTTINPSYDEPMADVPEADQWDVARAVDAAKHAFDTWRKVPLEERVKLLKTFAQEVRKWSYEFGMLDALDSGNPLTAMVDDVKKGADYVDYYAGLATEMKGQTIPTPGGGLNFTKLQPYGVVARILPFNHPIAFAVNKITAPLLAGNTVVLKPAELTPLSTLLMGKLVQEILPPGVVNIVTGDGPRCGAELVKHRDVRRIAFIGGVETGRAIIQQAGIKPVTLELGGKNPLVVYPDVDIKQAAAAAVAGMNFTRSQGQSCGSNSRVFVHAAIHDEFMHHMLDLVKKIKIGLAEKEDTQMGPVVSKRHYDRVMSYIRSGREEGAELVFGGQHAKGTELEKGYFVEPTIFDQVVHGMKIEQEEIFGPVMSVLTWQKEDQMLHEVNDVEYGLCANIWTNDISTALRLADEVEAGYVWINGHGNKRFKGAPFGGFKESGIGKEHSVDELLSYTQVKNINIRY